MVKITLVVDKTKIETKVGTDYKILFLMSQQGWVVKQTLVVDKMVITANNDKATDACNNIASHEHCKMESQKLPGVVLMVTGKALMCSGCLCLKHSGLSGQKKKKKRRKN